MPTPAELLIQRMRARRERWVPLGDDERRRVLIRRPSEVEMISMRNGIGVADVGRHVVGWEGFTEADLLGPELGSADAAAPFSTALWTEWVTDHVDALNLVAAAIAADVEAHCTAREAARGN
jgi:hypothetical protein